MDNKPHSIKIDNVEYVRADSFSNAARQDGLPYVIVRSTGSGCHAGYLKTRNSETSVTLVNSRRLWRWAGAAELTDLATKGTSDPNECKFPGAVGEIEVIGVCEIIQATEKARASIEGVKKWTE